jgi:hypothetical protein
MKRVVYILTLTLFLCGLLLPAVSHAANSDQSVMSKRNVHTDSDNSATQWKPAAKPARITPVWNTLLGGLLRIMQPRIASLYIHLVTADTYERTTEQDRPRLVQTPEWMKKLEPSDRRPEGDDHGWEDPKR